MIEPKHLEDVQNIDKTIIMRRFTLLLTGFISAATFAQSLSGNVSMAETNESVGYGNVDIYQGEKLIASVLTDAMGNFNVALDTGTYRCVVNYAGNTPVEKNIRVVSDEVSDFGMERDPSYKPVAIYTESLTESYGTYYRGDMEMEEVSVHRSKDRGGSGRMDKGKAVFRESRGVGGSEAKYSRSVSGEGSTMVKPPGLSLHGEYDSDGSARSGALTAGEVNDFSKWDMWQDLTSDELRSYAEGWKIQPVGRYTLMLQSQSGLPLADAKVTLTTDLKEVYAARTDNTGKAELWANLNGKAPESSQYDMKIDYRGQKAKLRNVKPFSESINHHMMAVDCNEMNTVDIAFVVDATGSMGDELSYLKAEMNDVIFTSKQISSKLNFRFANVFYRDINDSYVVRTMDFNRVLSESVQFINGQNASGGGDYEEAVELGLDTAIHSLNWSEEARTRIVFLILDAPPHNTEPNRAKLEQLIRDGARKGIRIVPVGASGINKATEYLMRSMAIGTNGTYTFLTDHSGIGNAHIEPSTDDYKVETFNDLMVRVLKSYTYMPDCEQTIPDLDLDYPDSIVVINGRDTSEMDSLTQAQRDSIQNANSGGGSITPPIVRWVYYPNPTNGIINIKADVDIEELFLTDLTGKLLQSITNMSKDRVYQMDLSPYPVGLYLLRYEHEGNWISGRVVLHP